MILDYTKEDIRSTMLFLFMLQLTTFIKVPANYNYVILGCHYLHHLGEQLKYKH